MEGLQVQHICAGEQPASPRRSSEAWREQLWASLKLPPNSSSPYPEETSTNPSPESTTLSSFTAQQSPTPPTRRREMSNSSRGFCAALPHQPDQIHIPVSSSVLHTPAQSTHTTTAAAMQLSPQARDAIAHSQALLQLAQTINRRHRTPASQLLKPHTTPESTSAFRVGGVPESEVAGAHLKQPQLQQQHSQRLQPQEQQQQQRLQRKAQQQLAEIVGARAHVEPYFFNRHMTQHSIPPHPSALHRHVALLVVAAIDPILEKARLLAHIMARERRESTVAGRPTTEIQEEQGKPRYTPPPTPVKPKQVLASPQFTHNSSQPGTPVYAPANYNCPPERAERGKRRSWGEEGSFTESERGTPLYAPGNSQQGQQRHLPSWRAAAVRAGSSPPLSSTLRHSSPSWREHVGWGEGVGSSVAKRRLDHAGLPYGMQPYVVTLPQESHQRRQEGSYESSQEHHKQQQQEQEQQEQHLHGQGVPLTSAASTPTRSHPRLEAMRPPSLRLKLGAMQGSSVGAGSSTASPGVCSKGENSASGVTADIEGQSGKSRCTKPPHPASGLPGSLPNSHKRGEGKSVHVAVGHPRQVKRAASVSKGFMATTVSTSLKYKAAHPAAMPSFKGQRAALARRAALCMPCAPIAGSV